MCLKIKESIVNLSGLFNAVTKVVTGCITGVATLFEWWAKILPQKAQGAKFTFKKTHNGGN